MTKRPKPAKRKPAKGPKTRITKKSKPQASKSKSLARAAPQPKKRASARPATTQLSPEQKLAEVKRSLLEISDLNYAGAVLNWDMSTYMPPEGADARGRQIAALSRLAHDRSVDPELGKLLDALVPYADGLPYDSDEASLVRVARRDFERAIRVPGDWVERANALSSAAYVAWTKARPANDFAVVRPYLEKNVELSREYAGFYAPWQHVTDPMIDDYDIGMTTETVRALFADLRRELVPIVRAICDQVPADDHCLHGTFPEPAQLDLGNTVVRRLGYDFARGRIDKTHHPFCTKFSAGDVRITTRVDEHDIGQALFSTIHEVRPRHVRARRCPCASRHAAWLRGFCRRA